MKPPVDFIVVIVVVVSVDVVGVTCEMENVAGEKYRTRGGWPCALHRRSTSPVY